MTVTVRFAPSPTGRLHVGNIRTALFNWLLAKGQGGTFILRLDDTDRERSKDEYAQGIKDDLTWLGLTWDRVETQSSRFDRYGAVAERLKAEGLLYPCYETPDELDRKRKLQRARGKPPVYDRAALALSDDEKAGLEAEGRKPHWRFKLSGERVEWSDMIRGRQSVDTASISDPILIREDGSYLYTLPSVVDDVDFEITHIFRGEDHVTNSGAQIEIFRAVAASAAFQEPTFGHTSLLVGAQGEALSKRLGSLSIEGLRTDGIEPEAITSLLAKLGTADPVEPRAALADLVAEFNTDKIGRAPARFDQTELEGLNARIVHAMPFETAQPRLEALGLTLSEAMWDTVRPNLTRLSEAKDWVAIIDGPVVPAIDGEDKDFIADALAALPSGPFTLETWGAWTGALKEKTGRKGKGLFMPLRKALTGAERGPEMQNILYLLGPDKAAKRLRGETA